MVVNAFFVWVGSNRPGETAPTTVSSRSNPTEKKGFAQDIVSSSWTETQIRVAGGSTTNLGMFECARNLDRQPSTLITDVNVLWIPFWRRSHLTVPIALNHRAVWRVCSSLPDLIQQTRHITAWSTSSMVDESKRSHCPPSLIGHRAVSFEMTKLLLNELIALNRRANWRIISCTVLSSFCATSTTSW